MNAHRFVGVVGLVTALACRADGISAPPGPHAELPRADYIAACLHDPGAKMRLYGCAPWVYASRPQPLIVIDGQRLPTGTGWLQRRRREAALRKLSPDEIVDITVISPRDTAAAARYGPAGRRGLLLITTKRKAVPSRRGH